MIVCNFIWYAAVSLSNMQIMHNRINTHSEYKLTDVYFGSKRMTTRPRGFDAVLSFCLVDAQQICIFCIAISGF